MPALFVPRWVRKHLQLLDKSDKSKVYDTLKQALAKYKNDEPEVSVIIPVWNEEKNLIITLSSLADQLTERKVELIIVNNNSTDNTQGILDACGVKSIYESAQSISIARQRGMLEAKGKFILNADSDSIYPSKWIDTMVNELSENGISCVYGKHSFIPTKNMNRSLLALYEIFANTIFLIRKKRREYLNVLGFNFGFKYLDGIAAGGFNTSRTKWSDGWMGMKLAQFGKLKRATTKDSLVWTSARRLQIDGGLFVSFSKRVKKELKVMKEYVSTARYAAQ